MFYCLIENGAITEGPCALPTAWRHVSGLNLLSDADLASLGWLPATVLEAEFDPLTQMLAAPVITLGEASVSIDYPAVALEPAECRANLQAYAARKRYEVETGGITLNGVNVATDRESQALVNGAYAAVQRDPQRVIQWKGINGFVALNSTAMTAIADAVAAHVQACFAVEAEVVAAIGGSTIMSKAAVDAARWPA